MYSQPTTAAPASSPLPQRTNRFWLWLPVAGFILGFGLCYYFSPQGAPEWLADHLSLAVLAGLDSVFGGIRAGLERKFRSDVFLSGFLVNMILAVGLVYLGTVIGVTDLYLAAVVTLGGRMFLNLSVIRRQWLERFHERAEK